MNTPSHDFVTVEMRGLKAALVARAQAQRISVSALVRTPVARELGLVDASAEAEGAMRAATSTGPVVKLSIRLTSVEAVRLATAARAAGLSRGAFLSGLIAAVPVLTSGAKRSDHIAALVASSAELSTLSRNIHRLTALLRQGDVEPARPYREMLDTLAGDVRAHLALAARVLSELRPRSRSAEPSTYPT